MGAPASSSTAVASEPSGIGLAELAPFALAFLSVDGGELTSIKEGIRSWAKGDPIDALFHTVIGGGLAFYLAEKDSNPNCVTPWDGVLYMATALSVGYDNLFPTTPIGHALATFAQTFGPALSGAALDAPAAETVAAAAEATEVNRAILARLDDIVRLLSARAE
jgi:hypothetical protein